MSVWAAQDRHVQHPGQLDVVEIVAFAAQEAAVLLALDRLSDPAVHVNLGRHLLLASRCGRAGFLARRSGRSLSRRGGMLDRLDDVHVARATADVAADGPPDLVLGGIRVALEQRVRDEHHARRAEPTLQAVLLVEARLDGRQASPACEAFDGGDGAPARLHCQLGAGLDRLAVDEHRAGAAARGVAPDVRAGEAQVGAQEVDQQHARLDVTRALGTVDGERDFHLRPSFALATAVFSPRWTKTLTTSFLYAALPRTSSLGSAAWAASRAASAITLSVGSLPWSERSASVAWMLVGPTAVRPMPAVSIRSPSSRP